MKNSQNLNLLIIHALLPTHLAIGLQYHFKNSFHKEKDVEPTKHSNGFFNIVVYFGIKSKCLQENLIVNASYAKLMCIIKKQYKRLAVIHPLIKSV